MTCGAENEKFVVLATRLELKSGTANIHSFHGSTPELVHQICKVIKNSRTEVSADESSSIRAFFQRQPA